jgi:hypothetical protein
MFGKIRRDLFPADAGDSDGRGELIVILDHPLNDW